MRTLVLRDLNPGWGLFFSDQSPKGLALRRDPRLALALWFPSLQRQWRLWGEARPLPEGLLDTHWPRKPRAAKLSDHVQSQLGQSQPVSGAALEAIQAAITERFASVDDEALPRPDHASGIRLSIYRMESLTLHRDAPHARQRFDRAETGWRETPLVP